MDKSLDFKRRREGLIAEIERAFNGVERDDGVSLHQARARDDYATPEQELTARKLDVEPQWQEVTQQDILYCCSALSFLDAKGFRYYIPAFMRVALGNFYDDPNGIRNSCEFHLTQDHPKSLRQSDPAVISLKYQFSPVQVAAIAKFLRFCSDFDNIVAEEAFIQSVEKWEKYSQEQLTIQPSGVKPAGC